MAIAGFVEEGFAFEAGQGAQGGKRRVILALEGGEAVRRDLFIMVASLGFETVPVCGAEACLAAVERGGVRLVVASWQQPDGDATALCRALAALPGPAGAPVVIVASEFPAEAPYESFQAGAIDFMRMPLDPVELTWRLRSHLSLGKPEWLAERLQAGGLALDVRNHVARLQGREIPLTPSECAILQMLMRAPGRAITIETLLVEALGYPPRLGNPEVVRTHIRNLRLKLEAEPARPVLLVNLPRVGYLLRS
ncbi:MAG: response regulator transcription factor [Cyanobacteria bacterium REEB65]|nr:response regulator transcription factor [Cyanobacteria bacterium REEB65]